MIQPPRVSVVITAHNAAGTIAACLEAVAHQEGFGPGEIEIVLVDDRSDDGTLRAAAASGATHVKTVRIDGPPPAGLTARQAALDCGIRLATAPVICLTDADGLPARNWVANLVNVLNARQADLVAAPIRFHPEGRWLAALQSVDSAFYVTWCRLVAALGFEAGVLFGNAAFRRDAYERVGGFAAIGRALTEDLAFARAVRRAGLRTTYQHAARVSVQACGSLREFIDRLLRTSAGGFSMLFASLSLWMLSLPALGLAALWGGSGWYVAAFLARYAAGVALTGVATALAGGRTALLMVPFYDPIALAVGTFVVLRGSTLSRVSWGGIEYER